MRDILTSPRIEDMKRKRRSRRLRMLILLLVLFFSLVGALAYFSFNKHVTINHITVGGTRIINVQDIESRVRSKLAGRYMYMFARANIFLYPRIQIYNDLLKTFPRIETLSVSRNKWNTLDIGVTERSGSYLYCGAQIPEVKSDIGENCYFINSDGYVFDKAPYFSGNVYFKYYVALSETTNPLGQNVFSAERFHALVRFIDGINSLGFKTIYLTINPDGTHSLYLANPSGVTSPQITFKQDDDLTSILDNLSAAMNKTEFANEINSKYATLLYIDLRFDNKVLYKFQ
jgi:hypothetical protein